MATTLLPVMTTSLSSAEQTTLVLGQLLLDHLHEHCDSQAQDHAIEALNRMLLDLHNACDWAEVPD
ncbi:hypothetical protein KBY71_09285 [Cyanobium sp. T1B-Tous]|uniref:hypothetical protein n=1 Tax=Cyanobium sp. T1B-Tous TaxID=2823721 RepID=UPI0020CD0570|nr:hypothetical protein [Cyanobium sp. T1B-Tous]MCP9806705.1 hypothetical protein [Cyanobium sp. T1B-Tous]